MSADPLRQQLERNYLRDAERKQKEMEGMGTACKDKKEEQEQ